MIYQFFKIPFLRPIDKLVDNIEDIQNLCFSYLVFVLSTYVLLVNFCHVNRLRKFSNNSDYHLWINLLLSSVDIYLHIILTMLPVFIFYDVSIPCMLGWKCTVWYLTTSYMVEASYTILIWLPEPFDNPKP